MSDDPVTSCEVCGAPVERVFRPVAVHFKGSGFYTTDYGRKGKDEPSKGSDSKPEKSDSKPEKTSESSPSQEKKSDGKSKAASTKD